jgi:hypothetical protein
MTPARTDQHAGAARPAEAERSSTTAIRAARRGVSALGAVALGIGGAFAVPAAAAAAPAPCEQADRYAAQSGAGMFRLNKLDAGTGGTTDDVVVAEAKSALVATAAVNAAAVTRMVDAAQARKLSEPLVQQAPPTHAKPARRSVSKSDVGPFTLGQGTLSSHAQWDPRMACGAAWGDVTRAETTLAGLGIGGELVRVPKKVRSLSTTALARGARTIATSGVTIDGLDLLDGAVRVRVVRPPTLTADLSTKGGGKVRYAPAVLEVSGDGIKTRRLSAAGDVAEFTLRDEGVAAPNPAASRPAESDGAAPKGGPSDLTSGALDALLTDLVPLGDLTGGAPLPSPVPTAPEIPPVGDSPESASAQATGPGTRLRISLGGVRQATSGRAIAAKATAVNIAITRAPSDGRTKDGYGHDGAHRGGVLLDLDVGVLEAAAVVPEPGPGAHRAVSSGGGAGLPITGPAAGVIAVGGVALLIGGVAAWTVGSRRRRFRS